MNQTHKWVPLAEIGILQDGRYFCRINSTLKVQGSDREIPTEDP
jgi:hypothetical protein